MSYCPTDLRLQKTPHRGKSQTLEGELQATFKPRNSVSGTVLRGEDRHEKKRTRSTIVFRKRSGLEHRELFELAAMVFRLASCTVLVQLWSETKTKKSVSINFYRFIDDKRLTAKIDGRPYPSRTCKPLGRSRSLRGSTGIDLMGVNDGLEGVRADNEPSRFVGAGISRRVGAVFARWYFDALPSEKASVDRP
jgi:hypothetical protein